MTGGTPPVVLSVAGSDSGGAAGIAADLATFSALGTHGACVVTAVTAQDTTGVRAVHAVPTEMVAAQLDAVFDDLPVAAMKTGMLATPDVVDLVARYAERCTSRGAALVVDPVLVATSGAVLGDDEVAAAYRDRLLPVATVVTPNADEARALVGYADHPAALASALAELGPAVVLTGGIETAAIFRPENARASGSKDPDYHRQPDSPAVCTDWLARPGAPPEPLTHPAVETGNDHGSGCTFSAALAAFLARGETVPAAVSAAAAFTARQLTVASAWQLGRGRGPIAHTIPIRTPS